MTTNTNSWNCNWTGCGTNNWYIHNLNRTQYGIKLQSPLGRGLIAEMALFCEELELHPNCKSHDGVGYLTVHTYDKTKMDQINQKADELGFTQGDVQPKGEACKCSIL